MSRRKLITTRLPGAACAAALAMMLAFGANKATAGVNSPPGCNANSLAINIAKNPVGSIVSGTVVHYTVPLQNFATDQANNPGCDIQLGSAGLIFNCPAPDGSPTGQQTPLLPGGTVIAAGSPALTVNIDCTVTVNANVTSARAQVSAPGAILLDGFDDPADILKTISINVVHPCISVTKSCVNACTLYGQPVQFTGVVTNCGDIALTGVTVTDDHAGLV